MYAVLGILIVLVVAYFFTQPPSSKEKFANGDPNVDTLVVPKVILPPPPVVATTPKPVQKPGTIPNAPYEQIAKNSPYPYQDPTLIKTTRQRILNTLEMLKGFLAFQANEIEYRSDPTIQLPLTTARGDFQRLSSEANVLQRNPGLQPDMTEKEINEINDNLAYLQREVELIGANRPFENTGLQNLEEGFENPAQTGPAALGPLTQSAMNIQSATPTNFTAGIQSGPSNVNVLSPYSTNSLLNALPEIIGSQSAQSMPKFGYERSQTTIQPTHDPASLSDLMDFSAKIQGEILRLSASGTTDPIVNARITNLTNMKNDVNNIITKLQTNAILPTEVPIMKATIVNALPILGKPTEPLPQILQQLKLPAGLGNMLPSSVTKDPEAIQQTNTLIQKYAQDFLDGASASFAFRIGYTSPREVEIEQSRAKVAESTIDKTGYPSNQDLDAVANGLPISTTQTPNKVTDPYANDPRAELRSPGHFNWKERARHIEDQVRRREIPDSAVGIMPRDAKVSSDFSWKGYAKMICTRLQASVDTGLPQACGCPPGDWKGW